MVLDYIAEPATSAAAVEKALSRLLRPGFVASPDSVVKRSLEEEDDDDSYLAYYSLQFEGCHAIAQYNNNDEGGDNGGGGKVAVKRLALFRLCPASSDGGGGSACGESCDGGGYGEYIVDLGTFVGSWYGDDGGQDDGDGGGDGDGDGFDPAEYAQCAQYGENYYVGPTCASYDMPSFGVFSDEYCSVPAEGVSFADLTGFEIPYNDGTSLFSSDACTSCRDNDDGDGGVSELCEGVYQRSGKCETDMDGVNYPNTAGCDYIAGVKYEALGGGSGGGGGGVSGGTIALLAVCGVLMVGLGVYVFHLRRKMRRASNPSLNEALNEGDGTMA